MAFTYEHARPAVTVDCVVFGMDDEDLKVALIRRDVEPFRGRWALPGGFVRMDEGLEEAARRELAEETGFTGGEWEPLGSLASSPSLKDNWAYLFLALGVEETTAPDPDEHELVEVIKVPVQDLRDLVHSGKIVSSSGVAAAWP